MARWIQETGLAAGATPAGPPNGTAAKAAGAGITLLLSAFKHGVASTMFVGVNILWLVWMTLGFSRAMSKGEAFDIHKLFGGAWKLVAVWAIWAMGTVIEQMLLEQGQTVPVAAAALGWCAVGLVLKSADAASHFFPGFRDMLARVAPSMFPPPVPPGPRLTPDKEEPAA